MPYLSIKVHRKMSKVLKTLALEKYANFIFPDFDCEIELCTCFYKNLCEKSANLNVCGKKSQKIEKA